MKVTFDLPAKIGDVVYDTFGGKIAKATVKGYSYGNLPLYGFGDAEDGLIVHCEGDLGDGYFPASELGKTVFVSMEEAMKALGK